MFNLNEKEIKKQIDEQNIFANVEPTNEEELKEALKQIEDENEVLGDLAKSYQKEILSFGENKNIESEDENAKKLKNIMFLSGNIKIKNPDAFDGETLENYSKLNDEISSNLSILSEKITSLDSQKLNSLSNFDLSYALKLQSKIDVLKNEFDSKQKEIEKINGEISLVEANYEAEKIEAKSAENLIENFSDEIVNSKIYELKFPLISSFLKSLSKEEALNKLLVDEFYRKNLGSKNYMNLYNEISGK